MNRNTFNAMAAQYAVKETAGEGAVSWDDGVRCVLPEVLIGGKVEQEHYEGYNRLQLDGKTENYEVKVSYDPATQIFTLNGTKTLPGNLILSDAAFINWDGAEKFRTVRQKVGGNVTLDGGSATSREGRYLLWSVFTNDSSVFTARTECLAGDEEVEFVGRTINNTNKIDESPAGTGYRILLQCLGISADKPIVFDNYQVRLMLVDADMPIPTAYEPYTGGVPVPNPDWPVIPMVSEGTTVVSNGGGTAVAPELLAIPGTEYRDTWNPQTGKGVRRCAVIESYAGETISTPYISSTGELSDGAYVIYGIADTPFQTDPQPLIAPRGSGQIVQTGGNLDGVPITVKYVTHS